MPSDTHAGETRLSLLGRLADPADKKAWVEFDRRYRPRVLGWCGHWGLQDDDAQEVVQRVMLRLVQKMRAFVYDSRGSFRGWLKTLARHALSELRAEQHRPGGGTGDSAVARWLESQEAHDDLAARLQKQFDLDALEEARWRVRRRVEPATWEAYRLTAEEGLKAPEVARRTGLQVEQVYAAKSRALKMLREELERLKG
jgi:RNA polymerase sigma-70 factor (ECF subfamily)